MPRVAFCLTLLLARSVAADPAWYHQAETWPETLRAAREALVAVELEEAKQPKPTAGVELSTWQVIGPFLAPKGQQAFQTACPPEQGIDLSATYGKLKWQARPEYVDGKVHDLPRGDNSSTYLYRTLTVKEARKQTLYLGSDDGCELFLNGQKILSRDVPRGCGPNQERPEVQLNAGENQLLYRIINRTGGYAFYFSLEANPGDLGGKRREELWRLVQRDFPAERESILWEQSDGIWGADWQTGEVAELASRYVAKTRGEAWLAQAKTALPATDAAGLAKVRQVYRASRVADDASTRLAGFDPDGLRLAIADLTKTFGAKYPGGPGWLARLTQLEAQARQAVEQAAQGDAAGVTAARAAVEGLDALRAEALLANPLLDFDRLLVVKRRGYLGLPQNWQGNSSIRTTGYDNELGVLSPARPEGTLTTVYQPEERRFIGDLELNWSGDKLLCSMPDQGNRWQVFELHPDGTGLRQITPSDPSDVHNFDACYLPDGRIIFCSTACFQGVPCVGGGDAVSLLYLLDPATKKIRQLTFDQDHSWDPTVLNNGRVIYTRWEYSDSPHYFTRLLFSMNPDGTNQAEYYGSNSYWPNSIFYARPLPGQATKVVGIVSGHHGEARAGELVLFDPARGRREAAGAVQRIPGRQQTVEAVTTDQLVRDVWPKFLHPYPLSDKYFLVSRKGSPTDDWGIWLVDVFDNQVPLKVEPGWALLEPTPVLKRSVPQAIPDKVDLDRDDATVYLTDVYSGDGLREVPRGLVKALRVFGFHFAYNQMGGHIQIGVDGPWDVKRILGTVPVYPDGSANFKIPANTPVALQPLDEQGQALQVMRSWLTAMPGEIVSCAGCHERQNTTAVNRVTMASTHRPSQIQPWYGPARGFSFRREVQPVLDGACVSCHDGTKAPPDLRDDGRPGWSNFTKPYLALHPFVRRPGPEGDYHVLTPAEFRADTSELVQLLRKGHHGVRLSDEGWDRLVTWIDLNVPCHGTWGEQKPVPGNYHERRCELRREYAGVDEDPEAIGPAAVVPAPPRAAEPKLQTVATVNGWPFTAEQAQQRQAALGPITREVDLGEGVALTLVHVPAGEFLMGSPSGAPDERQVQQVKVERPFWLGRTEITNAQYARSDPTHDSGVIGETNKDQTRRGVPVNAPEQPVVRVSWDEANAFCNWLSKQTGQTVVLPTEAQWEYACRAGSAAELPATGAELAKFANVADRNLAKLARRDSPKWQPRDDTLDDGAQVTAPVGSYRPNPWGLCDLHGNAAEWTRSLYRPYPYREDGRNEVGADGRRVVRGGSWYERPARCGSGSRWGYDAWQRVYNVGFRVVLTEPSGGTAVVRREEAR